MLLEAIEAARGGKRVFVVGASVVSTERIMRTCWELIDSGERTGGEWAMLFSSMEIRAQWPEGGKIFFASPDKDRLDWDMLRVRNVGIDPVCLVDHFAIEAKFGKLLAMYHRWDQPEVKTMTDLTKGFSGGPTPFDYGGPSAGPKDPVWSGSSSEGGAGTPDSESMTKGGESEGS
jgi:hypothetical protein